MWFRNLLRFWTGWKAKKNQRHNRKAKSPISRWSRALLHLEPLEDRTVPATLTVNTLTDENDHTGTSTGLSLREAIIALNAQSTASLTGAGELAQYSGTFGTADTIIFDTALTGTSTLTSSMTTITKDVIITNPGGAADISIDGVNLFRIFNVTGAGVDVTVDGLTLKNGKTAGSGAAIDFVAAGNLTLTNLIVTHNTAAGNGGALYMGNTGNLTIDNCDFGFNKSTGGNGGAVEVNETGSFAGTITIDNTSHFYDNSAVNGGAVRIYIKTDLSGDILIDNVAFDHDTATGKGGGASVYIGGNLTSTGSVTFDNGTSFDTEKANGTVGGGLDVQIKGTLDGLVKIDHTTFINSYAKTKGGGAALYVGGKVSSTGSIEVYYGTFSSDTAKTDGAGLWTYLKGDVAGTLHVKNSTFDHDYATGLGGGARVLLAGNLSSGGAVTFDSSTTFDTDKANGTLGGGLDLQIKGTLDGGVTIDHAIFKNNYAKTNGGGVYLYVGGKMSSTGSVHVYYADFYTNKAQTDGGGLNFHFNDDVSGKVIVNNSNFKTTNKATNGDGGGAYFYFKTDLKAGSELSFLSSTFDGNTAGATGGGLAIHVVSDVYGKIDFDTATVTNNTAKKAGGGVYAFIGADLKLGGEFYLVNNSTVSNNNSSTDGGGLALHVVTDVIGKILIDKATVDTNYAKNNGGGLDVFIGSDLSGSLTIDHTSDISHNIARNKKGGGIYLDVVTDLSGDLTIQRSTISYNTAFQDGGGLAALVGGDVTGKVNLKVSDKINHNKAGFYLSGTTPVFNPGAGGGVFLDVTGALSGDLTVDKAAFYYNFARTDGGAMDLHVTGDLSGSAYFQNATVFKYNSAGVYYANLIYYTNAGNGGALFIDVVGDLSSTKVKFDNVNVHDNTAYYDGGGLELRVTGSLSGDVNIQNGTAFNFNTAGNYGGGIDVNVTTDLSGNLNIKKGTSITYNKALTKDGGGVDLQVAGDLSGKVNVTYSYIAYNDAGKDGGGLAFHMVSGAGKVRFYADTVAYNTAGHDGGGIWLKDTGSTAIFEVFASTLSGNTADHDGGGAWLYDVSGSVHVINSTFSGNSTNLGEGGGIEVAKATDLYVHLYNSTIAKNSSLKDQGGGVNAAVQVKIVSCLIADNKAKVNNDIAGEGTFYIDYSLIENPGSATFVYTTMYDSNVTGVDPKLLPLAFNGGPTKTHALLSASAAIGIGNNPLALKFDQRGSHGGNDYDRVAPNTPIGRADAGSFEYQPQASHGLFAVGAGAGFPPIVQVFNADKSLRFSFFAFDESFTGGVTVAVGDVTGDGIPDIIVGAGPGGGPAVAVFDGKTGALINTFFAFNPYFTGGVYVATGDLNNDGYDEIIVGAGPGAGPAVEIFDPFTFTPYQTFFAFPLDFLGGVRVASGDVNFDGTDDVICGAGPGGGPAVTVFDGASTTVIQTFFAFDPSFRGGVFVAAGDFNGDGFSDIIVGIGASPFVDPIVRVFSGFNDAPIQAFVAYPSSFHGGVRVAPVDLNQDGIAEIITGAGPGGGPVVEVFGTSGINTDAFFVIDPNMTNGIFVG